MLTLKKTIKDSFNRDYCDSAIFQINMMAEQNTPEPRQFNSEDFCFSIKLIQSTATQFSRELLTTFQVGDYIMYASIYVCLKRCSQIKSGIIAENTREGVTKTKIETALI